MERDRQTDRQKRERDDKKSDTHQMWSEVVEFCDDFLSRRRVRPRTQRCSNFFFFFRFIIFPRGVKLNLRYSETPYSRTDCTSKPSPQFLGAIQKLRNALAGEGGYGEVLQV